jgi:hypothetical protein
MPQTAASARDISTDTRRLYEKLEERILDRDQVGASRAYYGLVKSGRPLAEIVNEGVRIHAPLTHVPYHERIDKGFVNFVNNDHCLLSARATTHLAKMMPKELAGLPMAQTVWYIPTGLDIWNQKINKAPGHYARGMEPIEGVPVKPVVHWPDQVAEHIEGSVDEKLDQWLDLVHRGHVLEAYRVFLGIMEAPGHRKEALAQLCFAGLIDLQDRVYLNRSYTTGHKAFRARATVELGNFVGWDNAHHVLYAGALDIGIGPRWYSTYEMACNCITHYIEKQKLSAIPYGGATSKEAEILRQATPLSKDEGEAFLDVVLHGQEPGIQEALSRLLLSGKGPRQILDVLQVGGAQVLLETQDTLNFSIPQHCYEYLNTLGWFYDTFDHPQRLKLLYVATAYLNRNAWHNRQVGDGREARAELPAGVDAKSTSQMLDLVAAATMALDGPRAIAWARAYLSSGGDAGALAQQLAIAATRIGNDPHNQELGQLLVEDYFKNRSFDRNRLLLACVQHTAVHRKYGDFLEASRRYGDAMGIDGLAA